MSSRYRELSNNDFIDNMEELLFITKFIQNKKEFKKERKKVKKMIKDFKNGDMDKYLCNEDDDNE